MNDLSEEEKIKENTAHEMAWNRLLYANKKGHIDYCDIARECENFYLGQQWGKSDKEKLNKQGRPALTFNQISPKINSAIGYQIHNRGDIVFKPRNSLADDDIAHNLSRLVMQIADNNQLHYKETQVFGDGLIQQRGFFDVRIDYEDTILGEIKITVLDPLDVIPDPDANSYDPDDWGDVLIIRWLTYEEVKTLYGDKAAKELKKSPEYYSLDNADDAYGIDLKRNSFASADGQDWISHDEDQITRYRIIERQYWVNEETNVIITDTGDIRPVPNATDEELAEYQQKGYVLTRKPFNRVKISITTRGVTLLNDYSLYNHFTVVPYFPFFRRGRTVGLVDGALDPQRMLNKSISQFLHGINSSANSGMIFWQGTVLNHNEDQLNRVSSKTGVTYILASNTDPNKRPQRIEPAQVPQGISYAVDRASAEIYNSTGINESMQGVQGKEVSGVAIQSKQFASQQQLAMPLDNLTQTRKILGMRMLDLIQAFYDMPRIVRITDKDKLGKDISTDVLFNFIDEFGNKINDLTIGEYDVVIDEVPVQITFDNSQFTQLLEISDRLANIRPELLVPLIRHSNLTDKQDIIEQFMSNMGNQENQPSQEQLRLMQLQASKLEADAKKSEAEAMRARAMAQKVKSDIDRQNMGTIKDAGETAVGYAQYPAAAPIADNLLEDIGFLQESNYNTQQTINNNPDPDMMQQQNISGDDTIPLNNL